jgi:AcrR family transcriptional regulator
MMKQASTRGRPRSFDQAELIETVMTTFWRHGYDKVSMDMLCEITKLTKPSFYNAFGTKEELFLICLNRYHEKYAFPLLNELLTEIDPLVGFHNLMTAAAKQFQNANLPSGCLVLTGAVEAKGHSKVIDRELEKLQTAMLHKVEDYFREKIQGKHCAHSHYAIAQFVLSQLYSMAMFSRTLPYLLDSSEVIKTSGFLLSNLLHTPP